MRARAAAFVALVGVTALAGCAIEAEERARSVDLPVAVATSLPAPTGTVGAEPDAVAATVYLVDDAGFLHPVSRAVPADADPGAHVRAVIAALLDGPTGDELARGLRSAVPASVVLNAVDVAAGVATLDLGRALETVGGSAELLASAQLVLAATAVPGVARVRLLLDGEPSRLPVPGGSLEIDPVTRDDYLVLLAP